MATGPNKCICIVGGAGHAGLPRVLVLVDDGVTVDILDTNAEALKTIKSTGRLICRANLPHRSYGLSSRNPSGSRA
jgi:hypothetical protein